MLTREAGPVGGARLGGWMSPTSTPTRCASSRLWLDAARAAGQPLPEAMTIATATSDGCSLGPPGDAARPAARAGLLHRLRQRQGSRAGGKPAGGRRAALACPGAPPGPRGRAGRSASATTRPTSTGAPAPPPSASARPPPAKAASWPAGRPWRRRSWDSAAAPPRRSRPSPAAALGRLPGCCPPRVEFWQESPDGLHDRIRYRRERRSAG